MPRESVGDVLRKAHAWLRPGGLLINIQPIRETMEVKTRFGSGRQRDAGLIRDDEETYDDIRSSERTVTALAEQGFFSPRAREVYPLEFHFPAAADWHEFLARPRAGIPEVDELMLATAWADPKGCVVVIDETSIATYERIDAGLSERQGQGGRPPHH